MGTRRVIAGALLATQLVGCSKMVTVSDPVPYVESRQPHEIWITQPGATEESILLAPKMLGDSVFGWDISGEHLVLPVLELGQVRAKQFDQTKTMFAVLGVAAALGAGLATFMSGGQSCKFGDRSSACPVRPDHAEGEVDMGLRTGGQGIQLSIPW